MKSGTQNVQSCNVRFFLDKNNSDCIYLDEIVFSDIDDIDKQEELWLNQYYGYVSPPVMIVERLPAEQYLTVNTKSLGKVSVTEQRLQRL